MSAETAGSVWNNKGKRAFCRQNTVALKMADGSFIRLKECISTLPPSDNDKVAINWTAVRKNRYSGGKKMPVISNTSAYNRWKNKASTAFRIGKNDPYEEDCMAFIFCVFPDNRRRDASNREKALFDALEKSGCVFTDDKLVKYHANMRLIIPNKKFIVVYVTPYDDTLIESNIINKLAKRVSKLARQEDAPS